jgi:hypothetical protein
LLLAVAVEAAAGIKWETLVVQEAAAAVEFLTAGPSHQNMHLLVQVEQAAQLVQTVELWETQAFLVQ